jgi:hypothetical protein
VTAALGPGSRVRFVGYGYGLEPFVVGRVYTVSEACQPQATVCSCRALRPGIRLVGNKLPEVEPFTNLWWCSCGFRPADEGKTLMGALRRHLDAGAPARREREPA